MNHDKNVTTTIGHLIDGKLVADNERTQPVFNPATAKKLAVWPMPPRSIWTARWTPHKRALKPGATCLLPSAPRPCAAPRH